MWNFQDGLISQARAEVEAEYAPLLQAQEEQFRAQYKQLEEVSLKYKVLCMVLRNFPPDRIAAKCAITMDEFAAILKDSEAVAAAS